jgi:creatinine amidohydrolase
MAEQAREVRFGKLSGPELARYAEAGATVLVPVGAIEQHAKHLPVDTDIYNAEQVSMRAAEHFDDILVAPSVPWGLSHAHVELGGTISVRPTTFLSLAMDLTETLLRAGFSRMVWINGHHGNKPIMGLIMYEAKRLHGLSVGTITYYDLAVEAFGDVRRSELGGSGHACEFETSLMMHLSPDSVRDHDGIRRPIEPRTPKDFRDLADPGLTAIGYTFPERFPEGVMGDPTVASAETGRAIFDSALEGVVEFLESFRHLSPYGQRDASAQL